jgi:hypothetical protein
VKKATERGVKRRRAAKKAPGLIRWDEIPHNAIWARVQDTMSVGSCMRASEDSLKHVWKRRLHGLDPSVHLQYVELECARIVETLRRVRDEYRVYLEDRGRDPLVDMYWVVLRYGVKDWAVMLLRDAAFDYVGHCNLKTDMWDGLFRFPGPSYDLLPNGGKSKQAPSIVRQDGALMETITMLLGKDVFDQVLTGGPFGRDAQLYFARTYPGLEVLFGQETLMDAIQRRQALWDSGYAWTEGLARMFDAAQEELLSQLAGLGEDGRRAEARFLQLSPLQKLAHKHVVSVRSGDVADPSKASNRWLAFLRDLDAAGISIDRELQGNAREVLMALRRKGSKIATWEECYDTKASVILDNGKRYRLLRRNKPGNNRR